MGSHRTSSSSMSSSPIYDEATGEATGEATVEATDAAGERPTLTTGALLALIFFLPGVGVDGSSSSWS